MAQRQGAVEQVGGGLEELTRVVDTSSAARIVHEVQPGPGEGLEVPASAGLEEAVAFVEPYDPRPKTEMGFIEVVASRVYACRPHMRDVVPPTMADTTIEKRLQERFVVERGHVIQELSHQVAIQG